MLRIEKEKEQNGQMGKKWKEKVKREKMSKMKRINVRSLMRKAETEKGRKESRSWKDTV